MPDDDQTIICGAHPDPRPPSMVDAPEVCPDCGGFEFEPGFGIAGGGYGPYLICYDCSAVVAKDQSDE